jgi:hypothetical protein
MSACDHRDLEGRGTPHAGAQAAALAGRQGARLSRSRRLWYTRRNMRSSMTLMRVCANLHGTWAASALLRIPCYARPGASAPSPGNFFIPRSGAGLCCTRRGLSVALAGCGLCLDSA